MNSFSLRRLFSLRRFVIVGLAGVIVGAAAIAAVHAQSPPPEMLRVNPGAPPPDSARDAQVIDFLQKRFKIPSAGSIRLGPMMPAPGFPELFAREVYVTNEQGQTGASLLILDKGQRHAIVAQAVVDMTKDPWDRQDTSKAHLNDRPVLGAADAPVTIVEFADFECPYCAHAFSVMENEVNNTYNGKVKLIFKNYPLNVHPWAIRAAEAAECARLQNPDAFWKLARYFYANQSTITPKNIDDNIEQAANTLKLDNSALKACMGTAGLARVKQDQADGALLHVNSTPTFFIDGIPVVGLPDNKSMQYVIDAELKNHNAQASR
jgi:protein-disulfide isomerase